MKILIDIGHPAHVHYFRNLIALLSTAGHSFVVTARDKEMAQYLLDRYRIPYKSRGKGGTGILGKLVYMLKADRLLYRVARTENPDLFLSFSSPYAAQVAWLLGKDHIALDDTENAKLAHSFCRPFSKFILTPSCYRQDLGPKQVRFPSYMELSYLHPNVYQPDRSILDILGVEADEKYVIMRFVGWGATHDRGHTGISEQNKFRAVTSFERYAKVFISSEKPLPEALDAYRIRIPPERMHDALACASMVYGESATMASEAAVLGTPSIYVDSEGRGYTSELEQKYGLVFNFTESDEDQARSVEKGIEILAEDNERWAIARENLLADKIDLTAFLSEFIQEYPVSNKH